MSKLFETHLNYKAALATLDRITREVRDIGFNLASRSDGADFGSVFTAAVNKCARLRAHLAWNGDKRHRGQPFDDGYPNRVYISVIPDKPPLTGDALAAVQKSIAAAAQELVELGDALSTDALNRRPWSLRVTCFELAEELSGVHARLRCPTCKQRRTAFDWLAEHATNQPENR